VRKLALLFVLVGATACTGGGGPDIDDELEKGGFNVESCRGDDEDGFTCLLKGSDLPVFVYKGKLYVVRPVMLQDGEVPDAGR